MTRPLLFEIGVEEIPSAPLYSAVTQIKELAETALREARLEYDEVVVYGAPRRLALYVPALVERQEDRTLRVKGPALKAAFDAEGKPTKAAEGFARGKGVPVEELVRVSDEAGEYVYAVIEERGRDAADVLPELLARLAGGIDWPKSQRWGAGETRFIRPVRWLLALFGADVVPVEFGGLTAGRTTCGHRFLTRGAIDVPSAAEYLTAMKQGKVVVNAEDRAVVIRESIDTVAEASGARAVVPEKTFSEVVNLVEYPTTALGRFDEDFLRVPREVLETAMESHQRYFPIEGPDGHLRPGFIVVHNGDPEHTEGIVAGHERVLRARLADAAFFYDEDLGRTLESYVADLDAIVFQEKLGTLGAKVGRIVRLTGSLASQIGASPEETASAGRAAHLAKADLVTHVVVEFPSLQGLMGRYYALESGEAPQVAAAIVEHYQPRFSGDEVPASIAGRLVSVSDKLDTICGIFAIGSAPTGSADPYGLRRGAIGTLAIALGGGLPITLDESIAAALDGYADVVAGLDREAVGSAVKEFIVKRLEGILEERGNAFDTVDAVLAVASDDPADAAARSAALTAVRADTDAIEDLSVAFTRAKNLSKPDLGLETDRSIMGPEERELAESLERAASTFADAMGQRDYVGALGVLASLRAPIDAFFDTVLVMDPDERLRDNRLRLLNRFVSLFSAFADFSRLQS